MKRVSETSFVVTETARLVVEAVLSSSGRVDQVATWLLAGYGLAGGLIVGNLEDIVVVVELERVRVGIFILIVGGLFGLLQKFMAVNVSILMEVDRIIRQRALELEEEEGASGLRVWRVDRESLLEVRCLLLGCVPVWARRGITQRLEKRLADPLALHKEAADLFGRQVVYSLMEAAAFVGTVAMFGLCVQPG